MRRFMMLLFVECLSVSAAAIHVTYLRQEQRPRVNDVQVVQIAAKECVLRISRLPEFEFGILSISEERFIAARIR